MSVKNKKTEKKPKRSLSQVLTGVIALVFVLMIAIIVFATSKGLDLVYLAYAAVESFFASYEIDEVCNDPSRDFFAEMDYFESEYSISVELYDARDNLVYSTGYKGEMSAPPYNNTTIVLPEAEIKNYEIEQDLGSFNNNAFNLSRDTRSGRNSVYLVGEWLTESGIKIKIFRIKSTVDMNAKIAVAFG